MSAPGTPATATAAGTWSRLHPLTPLLRGGRALAGLLAVATSQGLRHPSWRALAIAVAVVVPLALAAGWLTWRATRYRLTATELQVDTGILQRRSRRVPLARLQSVDVVRPLVARALGLAELRLEVAGGGKTEAPLAYLAEDDAHRLRRRLLSLAAGGADAGDDGSAALPELDEAVLVQVPTSALVASVLLSGWGVLTVLLVLAAVVLLAVRPAAAPGVLAALAPVLLGNGSALARRVLAEYGFTVADSPDGLRLRHGLLETRAQSIPAGRVQTVRIREPLLWRRRGWVRVEVDVAGYARGGDEGSAGTGALLPVAPRELAYTLVERVLGGPLPAADRPPPRAARWRAPLSVRRLRFGLSERHLVTQSGVFTTTTDIVPLAKVQTLRLAQGPWQRALGLASVSAPSAGRRLRGAVARHRDAREAAGLLAELQARTRLARRR